MKFHFPPSLRGLKRGPATVQPKDVGLIVGYSGIGKESICLEAGSGSGFLTIPLARICKTLYSYEKNERFLEIAKRNVEKVGLKNVVFRHKDILEGIEEKDLDLIVLDMPESEKVVEKAHSSLKKHGFLVGYLPNIEQAKSFYIASHETGFSNVFMIEGIVREYEVRAYGVRPKHVGLMHTAYLVFAEK